MVEVTKSDWKLFVEKLPLWQERYMECLLQEYAAIIAKTDEASARYNQNSPNNCIAKRNTIYYDGYDERWCLYGS